MRFKRHFLPVVVAFSILVMTACGTELVTSFKVAFAASKPFIQSLVTSGSLSQEKADAATTDIQTGVDAAARAEICIKSIVPSTVGARRTARAKCYYDLAQDLRVILDRHTLEGDSRLDQIAAIASGAIEAFEAYYTTITTSPEVTGPDGGITHTGADGIAGQDADRQLSSTLKSLNKQLKDLTGAK